jgi:hypothetical protein
MKIRNLFLSLVAVSAMFIGGAAAQVGIVVGPRFGVGVELGDPPVCDYGYYDYEPYACAPMGFYGPGYFYDGVFIGVGPWGGWGYSHGWGSHRFSGGRGGSYRGHGERGNGGRGGNHGGGHYGGNHGGHYGGNHGGGRRH